MKGRFWVAVLSKYKAIQGPAVPWHLFAFHFVFIVQNGHCIFTNQIYYNPNNCFSHVIWN